MNLQPHLSMSGYKRDRNSAISGIWLRWSTLTQGELVVCACIVLIPLWWLWGWSYLFLLLGASITAKEFFHHGKVRLTRPSPVIILWLVFGLYGLLSTYFYGAFNDIPMNPRSITGALDSLFGAGLTLWYIQSQNIRVRPLVVAWAFSVLVVEMLLLWLVIYFVWHQAFYIPHRSLFALLTGKSAEYVPGLGNSNYLMPYFPSDSSLPGMVRYVFFFHGPESLALVVSFVSLLALDIKNRLWSSLLLGSSVFLLLLSATRSAWLALPVVLLIRWLLTAGKVWGPWLICAAIALTTFTTTAIPPVTNAVVDTVTDRAEAVGELRADSTEVRAEIYRRTWEGVLDASDGNLFFGHVVTGETVLPGYAPAMVGSHSFYLGNLLYRKGLLGTGIFLAYWAVLIQWFYKTRKGRPMCSKLVFVLFSLTFCVMEWESVVMPLILICATLREPRKLPNHHKATEAQRKSSKKVSKWS